MEQKLGRDVMLLVRKYHQKFLKKNIKTLKDNQEPPEEVSFRL